MNKYAEVIKPFRGCRDGSPLVVSFKKGDVVEGDLARVALAEKWAKVSKHPDEVKAEAEADAAAAKAQSEAKAGAEAALVAAGEAAATAQGLLDAAKTEAEKKAASEALVVAKEKVVKAEAAVNAFDQAGK